MLLFQKTAYGYHVKTKFESWQLMPFCLEKSGSRKEDPGEIQGMKRDILIFSQCFRVNVIGIKQNEPRHVIPNNVAF